MQSTETWLPVVGYEGHYEVSSEGRVRSLDVIGPSGRSLPGRMLKLTRSTNGYLRVGIGRRENRKLFLVHRLVLAAFVGPCPEGMDCCHNNGTRDDNRVENLRWDTKSSNMMDKINHGTNHDLNKTHCPHGHLLELPNLEPTLFQKTGYRRCLACHRARGSVRNSGRDLHAVADEFFEAIMRGQTSFPAPPKSHCTRGHKLTEPNFVPSLLARGERSCLACARGRGWVALHPEDDLQEVSDEHYKAILEGLGTIQRAARTHCKRGHELAGRNLHPSRVKVGKRECLACERARREVAKSPGLDFQCAADAHFAAIMESSSPAV